MYFNDFQTALRISQGNHRDADYFMDCSYFEWYNRVLHSIEYSNFVNPKKQ